MQYNNFFFHSQAMKFNTSHLKVMSIITCKFKKFFLSVKSSLDFSFRMLKIIFCFWFLLFIYINKLVCDSVVSVMSNSLWLPGSSVLGDFFSAKLLEYWSGLLCCAPGDLPDPGIEPTTLISPVLAGGFFTSTIWEAKNKSEVSNFFLF